MWRFCSKDSPRNDQMHVKAAKMQLDKSEGCWAKPMQSWFIPFSKMKNFYEAAVMGRKVLDKIEKLIAFFAKPEVKWWLLTRKFQRNVKIVRFVKSQQLYWRNSSKNMQIFALSSKYWFFRFLNSCTLNNFH